jgi:hypothetical protein
VIDVSKRIGGAELILAAVAIAIAGWVRRLERKIGLTETKSEIVDSSNAASRPSETGRVAWVIFMTLLGGGAGYAAGGDVGLAIIGALAGLAVGTISVLVPLESLMAKRDENEPDQKE